MRRTSMHRAALLLAPLLFLAACSSGASKNANAGAANSAATGASANSTVVSQSSGGAKLNDCQYADKLKQAGSTLVSALTSVLGAGSSGTPASGLAAQAAALKGYTQIDAATLQVVNDLKGLQLPADLKKVNDQYISAYGDSEKQVLDAQKAAVSGNLAKAADIMSKANSDTKTRTDTITQNNKPVFDRLSACPK
ncbi:MAG: hypothetical protein ACYDCQ_15855 [Dehalococcoidia bacterium]